MFPDDPSARLLDSWTPAGLGALPWRRFRLAPVDLTTKAPAICLVSGLDHRAFVLAVYASCRGFPTATQDSLPAVASLTGWDLLTH